MKIESKYTNGRGKQFIRHLLPHIQYKGSPLCKQLLVNGWPMTLDCKSLCNFTISLILASLYNLKVLHTAIFMPTWGTVLDMCKYIRLLGHTRDKVLGCSCYQMPLRIAYIRDLCIRNTVKFVSDIWKQRKRRFTL